MNYFSIKYRSIARLVLISPLAFVLACSEPNGEPQNATVAPPVTRQEVKPQTTNPEVRELSHELNLVGYVDAPPQSVATLNVPIDAFVKQINLIPGQWINRGQIAARVSHPQLIELQRSYIESRETLRYLKQEQARQDQLAQAEAGVEKERQKVASEVAVEEAHLAALAQQLADLNVDTEKLTSESIQSSIGIYAPFSGYVTEVMVNRGSFIAAGSPILNMIDKSHLHLEIEVYERDIFWVEEGQKLECIMGNQTFEAEVFSLGATIDPDKRTLGIHAHPTDARIQLRPGAYVQVLLTPEPQELFTVPKEFVSQLSGRSYVFIEAEQGTVRQEVGIVAIEDGLAWLAPGHGLTEETKLLLGVD